MNQNTFKKLVNEAQAINQLWNLEDSEKEWLFPLLARRLQTALSLLESIKDSEKSYYQIADDLELHFSTVRQMISALSEGGVDIVDTGTGAICPTGRRYKLKKKGE